MLVHISIGQSCYIFMTNVVVCMILFVLTCAVNNYCVMPKAKFGLEMHHIPTVCDVRR